MYIQNPYVHIKKKKRKPLLRQPSFYYQNAILIVVLKGNFISFWWSIKISDRKFASFVYTWHPVTFMTIFVSKESMFTYFSFFFLLLLLFVLFSQRYHVCFLGYLFVVVIVARRWVCFMYMYLISFGLAFIFQF